MTSRRQNGRANYPKHQRRQKRQAAASTLTDILHKLVDQSENPAQLLELYYWSQEKELAAVMRNYLQLSQPPRRMLSTFLDIAKGEAVSVDVCQNGDVILSSAAVSDVLKTLNQKLRPAAQDQAESVH